MMWIHNINMTVWTMRMKGGRQVVALEWSVEAGVVMALPPWCATL